MISQFTPGQEITLFFVLRNKNYRIKSENQREYLSLELGDASGRIFGTIWDNVKASDSQLRIGTVVKVQGMIIDWHGKSHISIKKIRPAIPSDQVSLEQFLPCSQTPIDQLFEEFCSQAKTIQDTHLKYVMDTVLNDEALVARLKKAPGGKLWHHNYLGGVLEHTLNVAALVSAIGRYYPNINHDILLCGALTHDIGKVNEYDWRGYIDFSDHGRMLGHIVMGFHLIANIIDKKADFPDELGKQLLHLILSHHGRKEYGSPVEPMTREAIILNFADEIDSKMGAFERIYNTEHQDGRKWSSYIKLLDRFLYFGENKKEPILPVKTKT